MTAAYADLEIRILPKGERGYPVELTLNNELEYGPAYLDDSLLPWIPNASAKEDGQRLFHWFFADERLRRAWAEVRGQASYRQIRLRIDAAAPELHALPWEQLRLAGEAAEDQVLSAARATPFSRYLAGRWYPGRAVLQRPIRILAAIAGPENLDAFNLAPIDAEQELSLLRAATAGLDAELIVLPQPCTPLALEMALHEGYHVLHFVGHGTVNAQGQAALFLADENNQVQLVRDEALAGVFARQLANSDRSEDEQLRLVFLSSCQAGTRSPHNAFAGLAPQLVAAGVPAVLAMQDRVSVETAQQFATVFYHRLLTHGLVDLASNEARSAILTAEMPGSGIPVLFSRLRGSRLLAQPGRISSSNADLFWPFLLQNIDRGHCTPFLGPGLAAGLLPGRETVAEMLADKYGYPLPDRQRLVRVAQYMALIDPETLRSDYVRLLQRSLFRYLDVAPSPEEKRLLRDASFTETAEILQWGERVLNVREGEIHHLLADLELPLYVTTNFDNFMVEALRYHRPEVNPRRIGPRWALAEAGNPEYVLLPEPSREEPVVLHLNGHDGDAEQLRHLVLSEDDYLAHFVRLSRDQEQILPMNVLGMLSQHSFMFLGFQLDDWEFRSVLQGLVRALPQPDPTNRKIHVGVQLEVGEAPSAEKAVEYLERYLGRFNIDIYWGTPQQFVTELHSRWLASLKEDDWGF
jgi:hypothetical protein